jgi:putative oxidoreductase
MSMIDMTITVPVHGTPERGRSDMSTQTNTLSTTPAIDQAGASRDLLGFVVRTDSDPAMLLIRVTLAGVLFPHGAQHLFGWFGGYGFAGTYEWMTATLGIPGAFATLAIVWEFFAPLALIVGFGGRIAALGIVGLMTVAAATHVQHGFFMNWFGTLPAGAEGFEFHLLTIAMAVAIVLRGSGAASVDRMVHGRRV